ncbi:hypothetical protein AVEN_121833-1 [Araneus ventricosus]|uniref:Uncharacterized protein n=1 Tax=Araneus ventricosus TaxID=182803 RepID=A0A4Y2TM41_ARAVE|nr:hypothetical protein AVEN_121833-1 [Araneus ventricosus]
MHGKHQLMRNFYETIMPIYQQLASDELLERCARCLTGNSKEILHSVIWNKCSKKTSASLCRVKIAVADAVCKFNVGSLKSLESVQEENNILLNKKSRYLAMWRDYRRVYQRRRKKSVAFELAKKNKLARKRKEYYFFKKEGVT